MTDELEIGRGRDILVVDDHETSLVAIEAALAPLGRNLVFARSGVEALGRLLEQDFALILLDVAMPGMDGWETARMVRSRERNRGTPIIFITGLAWADDDVLRSYELGAFDFMTKPVRAELLRAKARVFVELQERTLALRQAELDEQRRRFEAEAMERQMQQLAEADRRKDEFLAILAHELRNPLQPIQTATEMLRNQPDEVEPAQLIGIIDKHLRHVTRLVDDLLDVARFSARKLELRRQPIAIHNVIEESISSCRAMLDARQQALVVTGSAKPVIVDADHVRLVQVMANLITNAAKYTAPGGRIDVVWGSEGGHAFVRVVDAGRGIAPAILPRVFDMFVQERVTTDGYGGLGLGLGLVKRLVQLHGGTVLASSGGIGKGSTFEFRLPVAAVQSLAPARSGTLVTQRRLRALVCDDISDVRELVAALLRSRGHEVTTVADGVAAVQAILTERPDVAFIDIGLPGMDGYEVARTVQRELAGDRPRLIALTGYGQASDRASALDAGFDAHVTKPATTDKLLGALA